MWLLVAVLAAHLGAAAAQAVPVQTGDEFLQALADAARGSGPRTIELQADVALSPGDVAALGLQLPLEMQPGALLEIRGAGEGGRGLDFGGIMDLLLLEPGASLELDNLRINGTASQTEGVAALPTHLESLPVWPSVRALPGATATFVDTHVQLAPSALCSPETIETQAESFQLYAERTTGTNETVVWGDNLTGHFMNFSIPLPVYNNTDETVIGSVLTTFYDTNLTCTTLASANASNAGNGSSSSSSSSKGGGTPGWVWAIVGVVAMLAVAAAAGAALWWWRRRQAARSKLEQQAEPPPPKVEADDVLVVSVSSDIEPNSKTGSSDGSGFPSAAGGTGLQDGMWKRRVGHIEGLTLGGVIGGGGFGRVYKGRWRGTTVAVKVVTTQVGAGQHVDLGREPLLSMSLSHPNTLSSYRMCVVRVLETVNTDEVAGSLPPSSVGSKVVPSLTDRNAMVEVMPADAVLEPGIYEMWLVSEFADRGSLASAFAKGEFTTGEPPARDMPAIMLCLLDIARGLEYLHSCSILHGDLKPQNVLLFSEKRDRRGFVCKLGDFGLSRMLADQQTHVDTNNIGTASHAAPELLSNGRLTKAADIYALGIIMWEILVGQCIFRDTPVLQIISSVSLKGWRPTIPSECPPPLAELMQSCWDADAQARPSAGRVVQRLMAIASKYGKGAVAAAAARGATNQEL